MKELLLSQLIETLRFEHEIEVRDEDGYRMFDCSSKAGVLEFYSERVVIDWFVSSNIEHKIVVSIEGGY